MANPYERIKKMMQEEGSKNNTREVGLGKMLSPTKCKVGDLVLDRGDLLIDALTLPTLKKGDTVAIQRATDTKYMILGKLV